MGVEKLLLISGSEIGQRARQHQNVIAAAVRAGVRFVAYTSLLHAGTSPLNLAEEHRQTEAALRAAGIPFAILRNGWYTENFAGRVRAAVQHGVLTGCARQGRIAPATRADYAAAIVAVLTSPGHEGKVYELAGDEAWTLADLAQEVSRLAGRTIPYQDLDPETYAAQLIQAGVPEAWARLLASWDAATDQGALFDDSRQLSALFGRPTTPMAATVAQWVRP